jgi:hypothetical protein
MDTSGDWRWGRSNMDISRDWRWGRSNMDTRTSGDLCWGRSSVVVAVAVAVMKKISNDHTSHSHCCGCSGTCDECHASQVSGSSLITVAHLMFVAALRLPSLKLAAVRCPESV